MKKIVLAICLSALLVSSNVIAATNSFSIGGLNINLDNRKSLSNATPTATTVNTAKIKTQISALEKTLSSTSSVYQTSVNDIIKNLLPENKLAEFKENARKLKTADKTATEINIDVAEDGITILNNALKKNPSAIIKNLSETQINAVEKDITALNNVKSTYSDILSQTTTLANMIKEDPKAALSLHSELIQLAKTGKELSTQAKNITKLTTTVTSAFKKAGLEL